MAPRNGPPERALLADEVLLPDELVERPRPHPGRERLALGRGLEQGLRSSAGYPSGWHGAIVVAAAAVEHGTSPGDCNDARRARG